MLYHHCIHLLFRHHITTATTYHPLKIALLNRGNKHFFVVFFTTLSPLLHHCKNKLLTFWQYLDTIRSVQSNTPHNRLNRTFNRYRTEVITCSHSLPTEVVIGVNYNDNTPFPRGNYLVTGVENRGLTLWQVSDTIVVTGRNHLTDEICEVLHHNYNINFSQRKEFF